jgi:putative phosphoribosyl transferase
MDLINDTNIFTRVYVRTLFIVGSKDNTVLKVNKSSNQLNRNVEKIEITEGPSHLFEERGKIDKIAEVVGRAGS